jgi:hypothetical protein
MGLLYLFERGMEKVYIGLKLLMYDVVSKIFRTGAAIYTAVVVARSTGPKKPN